MENVKAEYTVAKLEDNNHWVIFDPYGIEVIDFGGYVELYARSVADLLNSDRVIICWSYQSEKEGSAVLSELYSNHYHLLSHSCADLDGNLWNSVILRKQV